MSSSGVIVSGLLCTANIRVVRTDKYDNDPYRDKVVLHLPLHQNISDVSNYNRAHTLTGSPSIDTNVYSRKNGSCNINLGSINYASANWLNLNQNFTIEFWYNQYGNGTHPNTGNTVMSQWKQTTFNNGSFVLQILEGYGIYFTSSTDGIGGNNNSVCEYNFINNKWYHIVLQRTGNVLTWYINGVPIVDNNITTYIRVTTQPLYIGRLVATNSYDYRSRFNISDLRITLGVARYCGKFIPQ